MEINFKITKNRLVAAVLLASSLAFGNFVSVINANSAGGIVMVQESIPIGTVQLWYGTKPPERWLEMNGQSTNGYEQLAKMYGSNLPDTRGEFVRGWDNGRNVDPSRALRSSQGELLKSHNHTINVEPDGSGGSSSVRSGPHNPIGTYNTNNTGGSETRPKNKALMYIVKAKSVE